MKKLIKTLLILLLIVIIIFFSISYLIPAIQGYVLHHSPPTVIIERGSAVEIANYIVFVDDENISYAKNGSTGEIVFESSNASYVIQSAIDAVEAEGGGIVQLTRGTFYITDKILLKNKTSVTGQGKHSTILMLNATNSLSDYEGIFTAETANLSGIRISDMTIDNTNCGADDKNACISFDETGANTCFPILGLDVERVYFNTGPASQYGGLKLRADTLSTASVRIKDCDFNSGGKSGVGGEALGIRYCKGVIVSNCRFDSNDVDSADSIILDYSDNTLIEGCTFQNAKHNSIISRFNVGRTKIIGCHFIVEETYGDGIEVEGDQDITISGCTFQYDGTSGTCGAISVEDDSTHVTIVGNTMTGNPTNNLRLILTNSSNVTVVGNTLKDTIFDVFNMTDLNIGYNIGYVTENYGNTSAGTELQVTHGLAGTPTKVIITPLGETNYSYVHDKGVSTFNITSASSVAFDWYAIYEP